MAIPEAGDKSPPEFFPKAQPGFGHVYRTSGGVDASGAPVDDSGRKITKTIMANDVTGKRAAAKFEMVNGAPPVAKAPAGGQPAQPPGGGGAHP